MQKRELRKEYLDKRSRLSAAEVVEASNRIGNRLLFFLKQLPHFPNCIHTFLPQQKRNEVHTPTIVHALSINSPATRFVVPVMQEGSFELLHAEWRPDGELLVNKYGIPEPVEPYITVNPDQVDAVLVPLLAFDTRGNRVGYGGGYYDRFLEKCASPVLKIGLSFFEPVGQIDGVLPTDIRLDYCVSPEKLYSFGDSPAYTDS